MGLFGAKKVTAADVDALRARLEDVERERDTAREQVLALQGRLDNLRHDLSEQRGEFVDLQGKVADRIDRVEDDGSALADQVDLIGSRAGALGQQLSGDVDAFRAQVVELGRDVDALASMPSLADSSTLADMLDRLHVGQAALANELARQQIAMRQDLAELADQVRRAH